MKPGLDRETVTRAIRFLVRHLGLASAEEALAIVAGYYPKSRVPPRTQYLLEEIFEESGGLP